MRARTIRRLLAGTVAAGAATAAYASLVERNLYTLRRVDVPLLAPDAEPLRILHLSDLHLTPAQHRKQRWVADLAGTDPDLVVVTGDNLAHVDAVPAVLRALDPLLTLPGAFVFGSNDYFGPVLKNPLGYLRRQRTHVTGPPLPVGELRAALTGAGWIDLNNARTTVKAGGRVIELVGVDDPHISRDAYASVAGPADPAAQLHLGVTHSPAPPVLSAMADDGFELLLAGHTHGGQVCVPFYGALTTNCALPRRMAKGLHRWPGTSAFLHVSAGLGTHPTAPVRFACPPEATILTVVPR
jgi:predicted MPP superfamily phosphohydrolase